MLIVRQFPDPDSPVHGPDAVAGARPGSAQETTVVCARARYARCPPQKHNLCINAVRGGAIHFVVGNRRISVDDDTYLIFNEGRTFSALLREPHEAEGLIIFYPPGALAKVLSTLNAAPERLLDGAEPPPDPWQFTESLRWHDTLVSPLLNAIRAHVADGDSDVDRASLETHCLLLLESAVVAEQQLRGAAVRIASVRSSTRDELYRRVNWAADFIHSNYGRPLSLQEVANAARLSKYHLVRSFRQMHGVTPHTLLLEKRVRVARRLIETTDFDLNEIAERSGFGTRWSMFRQLRRRFGVSGRELRGRDDTTIL